MSRLLDVLVWITSFAIFVLVFVCIFQLLDAAHFGLLSP